MNEEQQEEAWEMACFVLEQFYWDDFYYLGEFGIAGYQIRAQLESKDRDYPPINWGDDEETVMYWEKIRGKYEVRKKMIDDAKIELRSKYDLSN